MIIPDQNNSTCKIVEKGFTPQYNFQETEVDGKATYLNDPKNFWGKRQSLVKEAKDIKDMLEQQEFPKDQFIKYITSLSYQQRIAIKSNFDKPTNNLLEKKINSFNECREAVKLLFIDPIEDNCNMIYNGFSLFGDSYEIITGIAVSNSNSSLSLLRFKFKSLYSVEIDEYIISKNSKEAGIFLKSLFVIPRRENKTVNKDQCLQDVRNLLKGGFAWSSRNTVLQQVIFERSAADLKCIDNELKEKKGFNFEEAIVKETNDKGVKIGIKVLLSILLGSKEYYSELLQGIKNKEKAVVINRLLLSKKFICQEEIESSIKANPQDKANLPKETMSFLRKLVESPIPSQDIS